MKDKNCIYTGNVSPSCKAHSPTHDFDDGVVSSISLLNLPAYEAAILGGIVSVYVNPIQSGPLGELPKVSEKILEFIPFLADLDAASAVILPAREAPVSAPLPHAAPCVVSFRSNHAVSRTCLNHSQSQTTAAFGCTVTKSEKPHWLHRAAITPHKKHPLPCAAREDVGTSLLDYCKPVEPLAFRDDAFFHVLSSKT